MDDDSNLNKNEFTALVSFAVNFHISHAQLVLSDLSLQCLEEGRQATGGGFKGKGRRRNQRHAANNLSPERSFWRLLEGSLFACWRCQVGSRGLAELQIGSYRTGLSVVDLAGFLGRFLSIGLSHELWILWLLREPFTETTTP